MDPSSILNQSAAPEEATHRWHNHVLEPAHEDTEMHLETLLTWLGIALAYLISVLVTCLVIVGLCLLVRLVRITLGTKVKPDGKKAILVTGATSGIGLVISKHFFKLGFTVIGGYFNDQEPGYAELQELSSKSSTNHQTTTENQLTSSRASEERETLHRAHLFLVRMDVRSHESIEQSSQQIDSLLAQHDLELFSLVNNAGVARDAYFQWSSRESIRDVIETNLTGVMMVTRQFVHQIIKSGGRIVNVASGLYMFPGETVSVYGASKSAVAYFSDALDTDLAQFGATCRCVVPGNFVATSNILFPRLRTLQEGVDKLTPEERELYRESIESYTRAIENLVRKRFALDDKLDPIQVSAIYRVRLPDDVMSGQAEANRRKRAEVGFFAGLASWIFGKLDGGANAKSLETSGIIGGYDYAVRLKNCPRRLYPGDKFYFHLSGPSMDYIPKVFCNMMAKLLARSIKNQ